MRGIYGMGRGGGNMCKGRDVRGREGGMGKGRVR